MTTTTHDLSKLPPKSVHGVAISIVLLVAATLLLGSDARAQDAPTVIYGETDARLERARKAYANDSSALNGYLLIEALRARKLTNELQTVAVKLSGTTFQTAQDYHVAARALASAGRYAEAEAVSRKALNVDPQYSASWFLLAELAHAQIWRQGARALTSEEAAKMTELLERSFQGSLVARASDEKAYDPIEIARRGSHPLVAALIRDHGFGERLEQKWVPLRQQAEEARDADYLKFRQAIEILRTAPGQLPELQQPPSFGDVLWERRKPGNEPTPSGPVDQAAAILDEALTLNRSRMSTNPTTASLIVSAYLNPEVSRFKAHPSIGKVLFYQMRATPLSPAWCEDFVPRSHFVMEPVFQPDDSWELVNQSTGQKRRKLLPLAKHRLFDRTVYRDPAEDSFLTPEQPATVRRLGPQGFLQQATDFGTMFAEVASNMQGDAVFVHHVEQLVKEVFTQGYQTNLFTVTAADSLELEAAKNLVEHAARHLLMRVARQGSDLFLIRELGYEAFTLAQFRRPLRLRAENVRVNEIDRLNGIEWQGQLEVRFNAIMRSFTAETGWSEWRPKDDYLETYKLKRTRGQWTVEWWGNERFHRPSERQIRDALGE